MKRFWQHFDKLFQKTEKKGFEGANKAHRWAINIILLSMAFQLVTFFKPIKVRKENYERPEDI